MRLIFAFLLLVALTACDRSAPKVAGPAQPVGCSVSLGSTEPPGNAYMPGANAIVAARRCA